MAALFRFFCLALVFSTLRLPALARENPYDLFGKVLTPLVGLFAEKGSHAVSLSVRVEEATGLAPELLGAHGELALEYPDRLRISAPLLGQRYTLCRRGQTVWVAPGSALRAALARPEIAERLPEPNRDFKLKSFRLPVPTKQLVFLPALFQIRDGGEETLDGLRCQVLDLNLMPELSKSLKLGDWTARLWVDEQQQRPVRLALNRGETRVVLRFDRLDYAKSLPPETWSPTKEEQSDVLLVPPARYDQLLRGMLGEVRKAEGRVK